MDMDESNVPNPAPVPVNTVSSVKFYDISLPKLIFLTVVTCGAFEIYWFYKNWSLIKKADGGKFSAIIRGIFAIFWTVNLFEYIEKKAKEHGYNFVHSIGLYAGWFIVLMIVAKLYNRMTSVNLAMDIGGFLLTYLTLIPIIYMQRAATAYNRNFDPNAGNRSGFSGVEVIWLIYGLIVFSLSLIGVFMNYKEGYPPSQSNFTPAEQVLPVKPEKNYDGKLVKPGTLRKCASFSCEVVREFNQGEVVHVIDMDADGAWCNISSKNGDGTTDTGWMTTQTFEVINTL